MLTGITAGNPAPSSIPVPDLQLTRDPLRHKSVVLITVKDNRALIQLKTSPKRLSQHGKSLSASQRKNKRTYIDLLIERY